MTFEKEILKGLEKIMEDEFGSAAAMARALDDMPVNNLTRWFKGERSPKLDTLGPIIDKLTTLGIGLNQIISQSPGAKITAMSPHSTTQEASIVRPGDEMPEGVGGVVAVYQFAAGGLPVEIAEAEPICEICIPRRFLFPGLMAVEVAGDSMDPLIKDGAIVGINRHAQKLVPGKVYAVNVPYEGLTIKRVYLDSAKGELILRPENPNHPETRVPIDERDDLIVGQVMWEMQGV